MLKRDELQGPSCLTRAADDEPIFVLRANDEVAPSAVRAWAALYRASKGFRMTAAQASKNTEALELARQMERWSLARQAPALQAQTRVPLVEMKTAQYAEVLDALQEATNFVDRHSEVWYQSGQDLLKKLRKVIDSFEQRPAPPMPKADVEAFFNPDGDGDPRDD